MATSVIGLKTHIWNNNIKSFLFLLFYPIVITPVYIAFVATMLSQIAKEMKGEFNFVEMFQIIIFDFWYVPYLGLAIYLFIVYRREQNQLNIYGDARAITPKKNPEIYNLLENLCISRGLVTPYLLVSNQEAINAYTAGLSTRTYRITITDGALQKLSKDEIESVFAHELTHIINGDTKFIFLTSLISHIFAELAEFFNDEYDHHDKYDNYSRRKYRPFTILKYIFKLGNIGSLFAQLFISRKREYMADAGAVELTKKPEAMISALQKIENDFKVRDQSPIRRPLYIHFEEKGNWLRTHPSIAKRIDAIRFFSRLGPSLEELEQIERKEKALKLAASQPKSEQIW